MKSPYILVILLLTAQTSFPQIAINEIMQSNADYLFVDNGSQTPGLSYITTATPP
ncbi:MAG: hypothetical protein IKV23_05315 [Bacteroidaceae bacterium]|nr:hypothetical protein [Bacteroidaceae bacterium]